MEWSEARLLEWIGRDPRRRDDAAHLELEGGRWAFCADQVVEGVHFEPGTEPAQAGRKLAARNLSDLAASGAAPRFGLLAYVVDAYRRGKSEDVHLVPVAIAYDQIQDVGDYTAEQRGAAKQRESFGWFLKVVRNLRRRYGAIHLRFGEPLSLAQVMGPSNPDAEPNPDEDNLALQKIAFEVSTRINRVTPVTPTSLVTLALLGRGDKAQSVDEVVVALKNLLNYVRGRDLPTTGDFDLDDRDGVRRTLDQLVENGVVTCYAGGFEPVYAIGPNQHLTAAYYRNTIAHFFVNSAIAAHPEWKASPQRRTTCPGTGPIAARSHSCPHEVSASGWISRLPR